MELLSLPLELLLRTLCFLDAKDIHALSQTHSTFFRLIHDSMLLQLYLAGTVAGVKNNVRSSLSALDRLRLIKRRELGWSNMSTYFSTTIPGINSASSIYDLSGGIYFRGDTNQKTIHFCTLPSESTDKVLWERIDVDKSLVDIGVSVFEHDLIAVLTVTDLPSDRHAVEILLLELSSGKPHPLAKCPTLLVSEDEPYRPTSVLIEIVGEHLVLVMNNTEHIHVDDVLRVFQWKSGTEKMNVKFSNDSYYDFVFLSPTTLLFPNSQFNTLDIWEISESPSETTPPAEPFLRLALPGINATGGWTVLNMLCRAEPNPTPSGTPHLRAPFHNDPANAIVVFNISLITESGDYMAYTLFVHRNALLEASTAKCSGDDLEVIHYLPSDMSFGRIPGSRVRAWEKWGPAISRVFDATLTDVDWITTTAGQRAVFVVHEDDEEESDAVYLRPMVLDFNPYSIRRISRAMQRDLRVDLLVKMDSSTIDLDIFEHPVTTHLPYAGVELPLQEYWAVQSAAFLMDQERLIVLLHGEDNDSAHEKEVEVLYMRAPEL
ncbi:hypothetical protein H0H92_001410 [Tricholoma furcatifolium]|nr:hypothetical protein H0H92_001410 [Tricholoma furcatifolium]